MLLVLDDFEHLLPDGVGFVLAILERAPRVRLIITSRERLRISGEWCVQLHGLDTSDQPSLSEATRLFVSTAQRINNAFDASEINMMQEICRAVHGIPLAIEMAASWTEVRACHEILADISAHVLGLTTRQRDIEERHRTLQAVFETTWALLSAEEQSALQRLACFRGGFTLDAARQVTGVTHEALAYLQDKMLIQAQNKGRLALHEMIRQFALEKLAFDNNELLQAQLSHAEYYVQMLRDSLPRLKYHQTRQEIERLVPEIENLRATWDTILRQGRADWFLDCWETLWLLFNITSRLTEGEELFRSAATTFHTTDAPDIEAYIRAFAQMSWAELLFRQGRIPEASALQFSPETAVVRESRNLYHQSWVYLFDSHVYHAMGNGPAALYSAQSALKVVGNDPYLVAATYFQLGRTEHLLGALVSAHRHLSESLRMSREYGMGQPVALVLTELGYLAEAEKRLPEALNYYESALPDAASFEDLWTYQCLKICIGRVHMALGQVEKAIDIQLTALRASTRNPVIGLEIDNFVEIAQILIHYGELQLAAALLEVCASHRECFQPTRNRAMQYLTALRTGLPDLDLSVARNLLPSVKSGIAALLIERLTKIQAL